jgi:hypothetical protein
MVSIIIHMLLTFKVGSEQAYRFCFMKFDIELQEEMNQELVWNERTGFYIDLFDGKKK